MDCFGERWSTTGMYFLSWRAYLMSRSNLCHALSLLPVRRLTSAFLTRTNVTITHFYTPSSSPHLLLLSPVTCPALLILVYDGLFSVRSLFRGVAGRAFYAGRADFLDGVVAGRGGGALRALGWQKELKQQSVHWEGGNKNKEACWRSRPWSKYALHPPDLSNGMWAIC